MPEITYHNPPELPRPAGYSQVVEARSARLIFISGQAGFDRRGTLVGSGDIEAQAERAFGNIGAALAAVGLTPRSLVKLTVFVRDMGGLGAYRRARDRFFSSVTPPAAPAVTLVEVARLFADDLLIEIEAVAAG
jgi:enamine deaminase RidA (YjgF/YER057c/UK114 family)